MPSRLVSFAILLCLAASALPAVDLRGLAGPDAPLLAAEQAQALAQWRALTVDSYRLHGLHDKAWDDDLGLLLAHLAAVQAELPGTLEPRAAEALAQRLAKPGACRDPLAAWSLAILAGSRPEGGIARIRAINMLIGDATARPDGHHPHLLAVICLGRALAACGRAEDDAAIHAIAVGHAQRLAAELGASIRDGECALYPALWLQVVREITLDHQDYGEPVMAAIDAAVAAGKTPPWVGDGLRGIVRINNAWAWRGSGWAKEVTPLGWKGFERNLAEADALLAKAWQENPKDPTIPASGCTVAGAGKSAVPMETWMLRSMRACFDHPDAFNSVLNFTLPRWGGSYARMLALGCDCVDTARFDTQVPWRLITVAEMAIGDAEETGTMPALKAALAAPRVQAAIDACLDGYIAKNPQGAEAMACYRAALRALAGLDDPARKALAGVSAAGVARHAWIGRQWHVDLQALKGADAGAGTEKPWSKF